MVQARPVGGEPAQAEGGDGGRSMAWQEERTPRRMSSSAGSRADAQSALSRAWRGGKGWCVEPRAAASSARVRVRGREQRSDTETVPRPGPCPWTMNA
ncbi:hypothetical protein ACFQ10_01260 [Streptomyces indonesiensis]